MAFALKQVSMINTRRRNFDQNFTRTSFWRDHFGDGKDFRPSRSGNLNGSHASSIGHVSHPRDSYWKWFSSADGP